MDNDGLRGVLLYLVGGSCCLMSVVAIVVGFLLYQRSQDKKMAASFDDAEPHDGPVPPPPPERPARPVAPVGPSPMAQRPAAPLPPPAAGPAPVAPAPPPPSGADEFRGRTYNPPAPVAPAPPPPAPPRRVVDRVVPPAAPAAPAPGPVIPPAAPSAPRPVVPGVKSPVGAIPSAPRAPQGVPAGVTIVPNDLGPFGVPGSPGARPMGPGRPSSRTPVPDAASKPPLEKPSDPDKKKGE